MAAASCARAPAVVTRVGPRTVELAFARLACSGCSGACAWRKLDALRRLELPARLDVRVGERVVVALPERHLLHAALLVHGLPLAALLAGALGGHSLLPDDLGAALGAGLALGAALLAAPPLRRRLERRALRALSVQRGGADA